MGGAAKGPRVGMGSALTRGVGGGDETRKRRGTKGNLRARHSLHRASPPPNGPPELGRVAARILARAGGHLMGCWPVDWPAHLVAHPRPEVLPPAVCLLWAAVAASACWMLVSSERARRRRRWLGLWCGSWSSPTRMRRHWWGWRWISPNATIGRGAGGGASGGGGADAGRAHRVAEVTGARARAWVSGGNTLEGSGRPLMGGAGVSRGGGGRGRLGALDAVCLEFAQAFGVRMSSGKCVRWVTTARDRAALAACRDHR